MEYQIIFTETFQKTYEKWASKDKKLRKRSKKTIRMLATNPFYPSLRTHKVNTRNYGVRWSSYVTSDIRIIWDFATEGRLAIYLLDIGGHSGKRGVYR